MWVLAGGGGGALKPGLTPSPPSTAMCFGYLQINQSDCVNCISLWSKYMCMCRGGEGEEGGGEEGGGRRGGGRRGEGEEGGGEKGRLGGRGGRRALHGRHYLRLSVHSCYKPP